jgi:Domain of unknown function (DUF6456)
MSQSSPLNNAPNLAHFLLELGRPNAWLEQQSDGTAIVRSHRGGATPIARGVVVQARAFNYLVSAGEGRDVLSNVGRSALRAALVNDATRMGTRHGAAAARSGPRTATNRVLGRRPQVGRAPGRKMLVEQLGARRDAQGQPLLSIEQVSAALRLANDFNLGQLQPRVTARWSQEGGGKPQRRGAPDGGSELPEITASAQTRWRAALTAIGGDLANVVIDVTCLEQGLETVEAQRHWPSGAGRVVLKLALDRLVEHYGMRRHAHKP